MTQQKYLSEKQSINYREALTRHQGVVYRPATSLRTRMWRKRCWLLLSALAMVGAGAGLNAPSPFNWMLVPVALAAAATALYWFLREHRQMASALEPPRHEYMAATWDWKTRKFQRGLDFGPIRGIPGDYLDPFGLWEQQFLPYESAMPIEILVDGEPHRLDYSVMLTHVAAIMSLAPVGMYFHLPSAMVYMVQAVAAETQQRPDSPHASVSDVIHALQKLGIAVELANKPS